MNKYKDQQFKKLPLINLMAFVEAEHHVQISLHGVQVRSAFEWITYTVEELGSLAKAIGEYEYRNGSRKEVFKEAIQVATLSLKIAEIFHKEEEDG